MKTVREVFLGFRAAAFVGLLGVIVTTANCGSNKANPMPGTGGKGGGAGGGAGTAAAGGTGGGAGTMGAAGSTASNPDAAVGDGGDAPTGCNPSTFPADAGCTPCSANPLLACPTGFVVTCLPFNNAAIPANVPRL